ncbi:MAG: hypothetical protein HY079_01320 [Elusimicrobia bacterium]|nr:hypothetical protein [Elusimicrobiota bacterium]
MTAIARRLDPCVNWFKLLARTNGRILWLFPALLLAGYVASVRWPEALGGLGWSLSARSSNAPLLSEARRLGLGYGAVLDAPAAAIGKPVAWCVDSFDGRMGFVDGRQTAPVEWTVPSADLKSSPGAYGYCLKTLSVVTGVERGVPQLRFVEKL